MDFDKMMNNWLDSEESWNNYKKDEQPVKSLVGESRSFLRKLPPEAEIDLHGKTIEESEQLLSGFLKGSSRKGLRKVLIIHGKGKHSKSGPVLGMWVKHYLETSSISGETGHPDKRDGGIGATWVILK
ncbi:MAG: Smr/MutS family protein [Spirochaetales bacterium]|nr:Smr/MutS family protein [Spirochaetales bacterium]